MNASSSKSKVMASRNKGKDSETHAHQNIGALVHYSTPEKVKRNKIPRNWRDVTTENKINHSWFLKDKTSNKKESHIYVYCIEGESKEEIFLLLGQLRDICLVLGTKIVYTPMKEAKTYAKHRYCFTLRNYKMIEHSTEFCNTIVNHNEKGMVSFIVFLYDYCYHDFINQVNNVNLNIFTGFC